MLPTGRLAAGSGDARGYKAGTGSDGYDPVESDFVHASHPEENILLIEGIHDLFAERQPIEELWQKWQQPEIWRLPHGHVSAQFVLGLMGRVLDWMAPRLEAG